MFEGLDKIDWKGKQAEQVPSLLHQMTSGSEETRRKAHWEFQRIVLGEDGSLDGEPKGGISEILKTDIHFVIIPFLIELILNKNVNNDELTLISLHIMAEYINFAYEDNIFRTRANELREAIWEYHDVYFSCLTNETREVQLAAIRLMCEYTEHGTEILPRLNNLVKEVDDEFKAIILWEIDLNFINSGRSATIAQYLIDTIENLISTQYSHALRITATIALIDILQTHTPDWVVAFLKETLITRSDNPPKSYNLLTLVVNIQAKTLIKLGRFKGIAAAIQVIDNTALIENGFHALVAALLLAFCSGNLPSEYAIINPIKGGKPTNNFVIHLPLNFKVPFVKFDALTSSQEAVIEAIVRNDWIWKIDSNVFNVFDLPNKREKLQKLI